LPSYDFSTRRKEGFGATGTARTNSGIWKELVIKKRLDQAKDIEPWGKLYSALNIGNDVVQFAWKDNALVLFLSTTCSETSPTVLKVRKRPSLTSTSAKTARVPFGNEAQKELPIPEFVELYNHNMNQVDIADQLRARTPGDRRIRRGGWHALWNFLLHVTVVNCYILSDYKTQKRFWRHLQVQLLARSQPREPRGPKRKLEAFIGPVNQVHDLQSGKPLRYCGVCGQEPGPKRMRTILGAISTNSRSKPSQKRRKTTHECTPCKLPVCKAHDCFQLHCK
jgi:Transposase IS4